MLGWVQGVWDLAVTLISRLSYGALVVLLMVTKFGVNSLLILIPNLTLSSSGSFSCVYYYFPVLNTTIISKFINQMNKYTRERHLASFLLWVHDFRESSSPVLPLLYAGHR